MSTIKSCLTCNGLADYLRNENINASKSRLNHIRVTNKLDRNKFYGCRSKQKKKRKKEDTEACNLCSFANQWMRWQSQFREYPSFPFTSFVSMFSFTLLPVTWKVEEKLILVPIRRLTELLSTYTYLCLGDGWKNIIITCWFERCER